MYFSKQSIGTNIIYKRSILLEDIYSIEYIENSKNRVELVYDNFNNIKINLELTEEPDINSYDNEITKSFLKHNLVSFF